MLTIYDLKVAESTSGSSQFLGSCGSGNSASKALSCVKVGDFRGGERCLKSKHSFPRGLSVVDLLHCLIGPLMCPSPNFYVHL